MTASKDARKLGRAIRSVRKERGLSLKTLASLTDTDKGQLSRIERGLLEPPIPRLRRIAKELGVQPGALLDP
jgi:transcriptional regulator with XRE-family HTH domain